MLGSSPSPVYVSIATIPSRIGLIRPTLESLLSGELVPTKIFVNRPEFCKLEQSGYEVPDFLIDENFCRGIVEHNITSADWGPGTKILGPIPRLEQAGYLVIADDDVLYDKSFLSRLMDAQVGHEDRAHSYFAYRERGLTICTGCDGLAVASARLDGMLEFFERHVAGTTLAYHDDMWIAYYLALRGVEIRQVEKPPEKSLIYEQLLPNDVLSAQEGALKRERIVQEHLPRLFREARLPLATAAALNLRALSDAGFSLASRISRKLLRLGKFAR